MKKKIVLALLGQTKAWKTTFAALLSTDFQRIIEISTQPNYRTKITTEYCFEPNAKLNISEIIPFIENIMGSADGNTDKYNINIEKHKEILQDILHLEQVNERTDLREYIEYQLNLLCGSEISNEDLVKILTCEGISEFIKKIQVTLPPVKEIAEMLNKHNIQLVLRDTRGILDVVKKDDNTISVPSLNDLGLDNLDGIIFFATESYPNIVADIYGHTLEAVMKALPIFLIGKDPYLYYIATNSNKSPDDMINTIQQRKHDIYKTIDKTIFGNTFKLFSEIGIMDEVENGNHEYKEYYYNIRQTEYLLPVIDSLTTLTDVSKLCEKDDFKFLQNLTINVVIDIISKTIYIGDNRFLVLGDPVVIEQTKVALQNFDLVCEVYKDWELFDQKDRSHTKYIRPVLQDKTRSDINNIILDSSNLFLGKYNGITTQSNGKWRYPATIVSAVSARILIMSFLQNFTLDGTNGVEILNMQKMPISSQTLYIRKVLQDFLYRYYTDVYATISGYPIINRSTIVESMKKISKNLGKTLDVFPLVIQDSIVTFLNYLKNEEYIK